MEMIKRQKSIIHSSIHPRYKCSGLCRNCYLKRNVDDMSVSLTLDNLLTAIETISNFYHRNDFDSISYALMINTNDINTVMEDCALGYKLYPISTNYNMKVDYIEAYVNSDMITNEDRNIIQNICKTIHNIGDTSGVETSLWISDLPHVIGEEYIEHVKELSDICNINMTITVTPGIDIPRIRKSIGLWKSALHENAILYINSFDDNGIIHKESIVKSALLVKSLIGIINIEPDFCVISDTDSDLHKICSVFPDGTVRNCPYLPIPSKEENILQDTFCYDKCPHKLALKMTEK